MNFPFHRGITALAFVTHTRIAIVVLGAALAIFAVGSAPNEADVEERVSLARAELQAQIDVLRVDLAKDAEMPAPPGPQGEQGR